jgi:hypothetical protein
MTDPSQADSRLVAEFIAILKTLARDPDLLGARARAVLDHPPPDWEETTAPLLAFLQGADASK